jgi:hypothetical protein
MFKNDRDAVIKACELGLDDLLIDYLATIGKRDRYVLALGYLTEQQDAVRNRLIAALNPSQNPPEHNRSSSAQSERPSMARSEVSTIPVTASAQTPRLLLTV